MLFKRFQAWRYGFFLILLSAALMLSGCWDRRELNNMAIIGIAGVDKVEDGFRLTLSIIRPSTMSVAGQASVVSPEKGVWRVSDTGKTLHDAEMTLDRKSPRTLYWGQSRIMVISKEAAELGLDQFLDFLARHPEMRLNTWVLITPGPAEDIVASVPEMENSAAEEIQGILLRQKGWTQGTISTAHDILRRFHSPALEPLISLVDLYNHHPSNPKPEGVDYLVRKSVFLEGSVALREGKYAGKLNRDATRGALWIIGRVNQGPIVVAGPDEEKVSITITSGSASIKPIVKGGDYKIRIKVKAEGNIVENQGNQHMDKPETMLFIEENAKKEMERTMKEAISRMRELKTDFLGLGQSIRRQYPDRWQTLEKNWPDRLPELDIALEVSFALRRPGMISRYIQP